MNSKVASTRMVEGVGSEVRGAHGRLGDVPFIDRGRLPVRAVDSLRSAQKTSFL
jgi:hypothetical protein